MNIHISALLLLVISKMQQIDDSVRKQVVEMDLSLRKGVVWVA
jgi:hypothetical protein